MSHTHRARGVAAAVEGGVGVGPPAGAVAIGIGGHCKKGSQQNNNESHEEKRVILLFESEIL